MHRRIACPNNYGNLLKTLDSFPGEHIIWLQLIQASRIAWAGFSPHSLPSHYSSLSQSGGHPDRRASWRFLGAGGRVFAGHLRVRPGALAFAHSTIGAEPAPTSNRGIDIPSAGINRADTGERRHLDLRRRRLG